MIMEKAKIYQFLSKYRGKIFFIFTLFYFLVLYYVTGFKFDGFFDFMNRILWYVVGVNFLLFRKANDFNEELFFRKTLYEEVVQDILIKGFTFVKSSKSKVYYSKKSESFFKEKITITKYDNGIWSIYGKNSNLHDLEKYMVRYQNK